MEPTARRQSLREQLSQAREALDRGEPTEALAAVERALLIDPDYLAAQALKERILRQAAAPPASAAPRAATPNVSASPMAASAIAAGVLRMETRTRARRIEKRAEAARAALAGGRMKDARAAIDEIAALDPQCPELSLLLTELQAPATRRGRWPHIGPVVAAVAVFAAVTLVARYADSPSVGVSPAAVVQPAPAADRTDAAAPDVADAAPVAAAVADAPAAGPSTPVMPALPRQTPAASPAPPVPTAGAVSAAPSSRPASIEVIAGPAPVRAEPAPTDSQRVPPAMPSIAPIEPTDPGQLPGILTTPPQDARARAVERTSDAVAVSRPLGPAPAAAGRAVGDEDLVLRTLQQYRRAYDTLDARAAQAVWPGVDSEALQRAFDGLVSQRLTFQSCELHVSGSAATAACRGTARYTPRVGSREARAEPRDWRFTLRKTTSDDWQIESARVAR